MKDPVTLAKPIHLRFVKTPKFPNVHFLCENELILIVPLHTSDGGEKVVPHRLPDLLNAIALIAEDSSIPFLLDAPHDHSR